MKRELHPTTCTIVLGFCLTLGLCMLTATTCVAATPPCTVAAARLAAAPGMTIGLIKDLNPKLPPVPDGALLVPEERNDLQEHASVNWCGT
jgi:hypothetical protein